MALIQTPHSKPRALGRPYTQVWLNNGAWAYEVVRADGTIFAREFGLLEAEADRLCKAAYQRLVSED